MILRFRSSLGRRQSALAVVMLATLCVAVSGCRKDSARAPIDSSPTQEPDASSRIDSASGLPVDGQHYDAAPIDASIHDAKADAAYRTDAAAVDSANPADAGYRPYLSATVWGERVDFDLSPHATFSADLVSMNIAGHTRDQRHLIFYTSGITTAGKYECRTGQISAVYLIPGSKVPFNADVGIGSCEVVFDHVPLAVGEKASGSFEAKVVEDGKEGGWEIALSNGKFDVIAQ
ncbi:MAG: hypothetical protein V2A73_14250 [Pseudomonadota bacterium]